MVGGRGDEGGMLMHSTGACMYVRSPATPDCSPQFVFRYAAVRCGLAVVAGRWRRDGVQSLEVDKRSSSSRSMWARVGQGRGGGRHDHSLVTLSPLCSSKRFSR